VIIPQDQVLAFASDALTARNEEQARLEKISKYVRGRHEQPYAPRGASSEYRWLMKKSRRNFLPLIVSVLSQNLHVDGYKASGETVVETVSTEKPNPAWDAFRANRMVSRQHGVHRSIIKYGSAYVVVLPGQMSTDEEQPQKVPVIRPASPRRLTAFYADETDDEWPLLAIEVRIVRDSKSPGKQRKIVSVYDEKNRYLLTGPAKGGELHFAEDGDPLLGGQTALAAHDLGICPVIRFLHEADLDGEMDCSGEVEPLLLIQDQINFDTFNAMITEQYAAFRQRWITGMAPVDEQGRMVQPFRPGVDRVWVAEDAAARFGDFSESSLQQYLDSREGAIRHMSTISQVPPYHLLGQIANLSAEALAAARDGLDRKVEELQANNTDPWRNVFRLTAKAAGDDKGWNDLNGTVVWRDTSARAFSATIDALGKAAQMLGIPVEELWRRIPGVTADDVNSWFMAKKRAEAQAMVQQAVTAAQPQLPFGQTPPNQSGAGQALPRAPSPAQMQSRGAAGTPPPGTPPPRSGRAAAAGGPVVGTRAPAAGGRP
jgi:Phage portal protein, SPP1 Gp6-like